MVFTTELNQHWTDFSNDTIFFSLFGKIWPGLTLGRICGFISTDSDTSVKWPTQIWVEQTSDMKTQITHTYVRADRILQRTFLTATVILTHVGQSERPRLKSTLDSQRAVEMRRACRNQTCWQSANLLYFCNAWLSRPHSHPWVINQDCESL